MNTPMIRYHGLLYILAKNQTESPEEIKVNGQLYVKIHSAVPRANMVKCKCGRSRLPVYMNPKTHKSYVGHRVRKTNGKMIRHGKNKCTAIK